MITYIAVRAFVLGIVGLVLFLIYKLVDGYLNKKMKDL